MKFSSLFLLLLVSICMVFAFSHVGMGNERRSSASIGDMPKRSNAKEMVCVMLIDPTIYVEEDGFKKIARSIYQIAKSFPANSRIEVRQIDDNPYLAPLATYSIPPQPSSPPSAIRAYPLKVENGAKMLGETVFRRLKEIKAQTPHTSSKSCIVRGLQTAYDVLKHYPQSTYDWEVIVMSDMIEECDNSPIGEIYMTPEGYQHAKERMDSYQPGFDLSHAELSVLVIRNYEPGDPEYLQPDHLRQLWDTLFAKVGYSQQDLDQMYFGSAMPPRFQLARSK